MASDKIVTLRTKLLIPKLPETIVRKRLNSLFEEIRTRRVVIVVAGAGYGKTTLVAQTCRKLKTDVVWYSLSSFDSDFINFIFYLITGIKQHYPDFGQSTLKRIESAQTIREKETVLTYLLKEIEETIKRELVIVLDDLHFVQDNPEIKETLVFLMKYLPGTVHLVLISRKTPDLNLSGFIARREIFLIDEKALAFDVGEVKEFYQRLFNISLPSKILEILQAKTEGWVSGLILFQHTFEGRNQEEIEAHLDKLGGTSRMIFNFLEENVYGLLSEEIKDFLLKTSILSRLDISFCNRYLEKQSAREILTELEGKHLFTFPFDEQRESWCYHHLFQDYLLEKLGHEFNEKEIAELHTRAGQIWEDSSEPDQALNHYLQAGLFEEAGQLLSQAGRQFLRDGKINLFLTYFTKISDEFKEKKPWLHYTHGRALELHGRSKEASLAFERAKGQFAEQGVAKGVGLALNRLSSYYYTIGDFQKAEAVLKEIVTGIPEMPNLHANALGNLIFVTSHVGKFEESDRYFEESKCLFEEMITRDLQAWITINNGFRYFTSGDTAKAIDLGNKGIKTGGSPANDDLLSYAYHLLSISNYYHGNYSEGLTLALKGIRLGEEKGFRGMNHVWHLINAASCSATAGDLVLAREYGETGVKICQEIESLWSEAWAYLSLCITHQRSGDLEQAEQCARAAVSLLENLSLPGDEGVMKGTLASILMEQGKLEEVENLLTVAEEKLNGSKLNQSRIYFYAARYYWEKQDFDKALKKLSSGLELSENNSYDYWIIEEKHWIIPLLVDLYLKGYFRDYLNKLFPKFGAAVVGELNKIQQHKNNKAKKSVEALLDKLPTIKPVGLRVFCFGAFKLFRGDDEIPVEEWKSEKARMLFKYLVYHQAKGYMPKDMLMELLWPETDPEKSRKRFNVALTSIRKILEPELQRGTPSTYLLRKGDGYRLNFGDNGFLDITAFDSALEQAGKESNPDKLIEHYLQAETLYKGDLFQEDQYQEWCWDTRSIYREKYLHVLDFLLSFFKNRGELLKAIEYARKYLEFDQYAEIIYQNLMKMYQQTNNKTLLKKTYEDAKQKLENELDSPLSQETEKLYKELISL